MMRAFQGGGHQNDCNLLYLITKKLAGTFTMFLKFSGRGNCPYDSFAGLVLCRADASGGAVVPGPAFKIGAPHFTSGPPVAAYIQYCILKMWPLLVFGPLAAKFW